jgi:succinoglycan biosynthesis protein ExoM
MLRTSVCIATYRRPIGLSNLLRSLAVQQGAPSFEVVVVDNDRDGSAAAVVEKFADQLALRYVVEPQRGLSRVRNRSVAESRGTFIAFIDDDEVAPPTWLATLDRVRASTRSGAVFGPVHVEFDPAISDEIRRCRLLRTRMLEEGARLEWYHSRTSNAYVDRAALPPGEPPFRMAFDRTGGEDIDLFFRMAKAGATFAAAGPDAAVKEFRERSRSDFAWVLRRSLRNGGNLAELEEAGKSTKTRAARAMQGIRRSATALVKARKARHVDQLTYIEHLIDACEEAGRTLWFFGYCYKEYVP